jgi:hypothetical protein
MRWPDGKISHGQISSYLAKGRTGYYERMALDERAFFTEKPETQHSLMFLDQLAG